MKRIFIVLVALAILYTMADFSTTAGPIVILFAEGCWARCQLPNGIRYISVGSKLMNPPTFLRLVFLKVLELDGRFHHDRLTVSGSECGRLLGMTPSTRWYKVRLCCIKTDGSACPSQIGLWTKVMESSIADNSTTA